MAGLERNSDNNPLVIQYEAQQVMPYWHNLLVYGHEY